MKSTTIVTVAKHLNNQPGETESDDPKLGESNGRLSLQLLNPDHDHDRDHLQLAKLKSTTIVTVDSMTEWDSPAPKLFRSHQR
nr:hypothetical protein CFP56_28194 [Quercus suber]